MPDFYTKVRYQHLEMQAVIHTATESQISAHKFILFQRAFLEVYKGRSNGTTSYFEATLKHNTLQMKGGLAYTPCRDDFSTPRGE